MRIGKHFDPSRTTYWRHWRGRIFGIHDGSARGGRLAGYFCNHYADLTGSIEQCAPGQVRRHFLPSREFDRDVRQQTALGIEHCEGGLRARNYFRRKDYEARGCRWGCRCFRLLRGCGAHRRHAIQQDECQEAAQPFKANPRTHHSMDSNAAGLRERNRGQRAMVFLVTLICLPSGSQWTKTFAVGARERQSPDWRAATRQSGDWRSRGKKGQFCATDTLTFICQVENFCFEEKAIQFRIEFLVFDGHFQNIERTVGGHCLFVRPVGGG